MKTLDKTFKGIPIKKIYGLKYLIVDHYPASDKYDSFECEDSSLDSMVTSNTVLIIEL